MVLHRPVEPTPLTGQVKLAKIHMSGNATNQELALKEVLQRGGS
jgi:hypothetical protein